MHAVLMTEGTLHNVAEDLCIPVGMGTKTSTGLDIIVIEHAQAAKILPLRVKMVCNQRDWSLQPPKLLRFAAT